MKIADDAVPGYERVVVATDPERGYSAIIAIHSTVHGPAGGGTRFWNYRTRQEALQDVLRLARGMTYKNALAELPMGGGKAVIIRDNATNDREKIFRAHGHRVTVNCGSDPTTYLYANAKLSVGNAVLAISSDVPRSVWVLLRIRYLKLGLFLSRIEFQVSYRKRP